jgi:hypothetical protein
MNNITYEWEITRLECALSDGVHSNVVVLAHWKCTGVQKVSIDSILTGGGGGEGYKYYTELTFGTASLEPPNGVFVPFNLLQPAVVLDWVYASGVDKDAIEALLRERLHLQANPPLVELTLPWA